MTTETIQIDINLATKEEEKTQEENEVTCPICGSDSFMVAGHCFTCMSCGYSLCSL